MTVGDPGRRAFLLAAASGVTAVLVRGEGGAWPTLLTFPGDPLGPRAILIRWFGEELLVAAAILGRAWAEVDRPAAQAGLDAIARGIAARPAVDDAIAWLEARRSADFSEARLTDLHGWLLSPTELSLCALVEATTS